MLNYRVLIHYHNQLGNYAAYNMWKWQMNKWGEESAFSSMMILGFKEPCPIQANKL